MSLKIYSPINHKKNTLLNVFAAYIMLKLVIKKFLLRNSANNVSDCLSKTLPFELIKGVEAFIILWDAKTLQQFTFLSLVGATAENLNPPQTQKLASLDPGLPD